MPKRRTKRLPRSAGQVRSSISLSSSSGPVPVERASAAISDPRKETSKSVMSVPSGSIRSEPWAGISPTSALAATSGWSALSALSMLSVSASRSRKSGESGEAGESWPWAVSASAPTDCSADRPSDCDCCWSVSASASSSAEIPSGPCAPAAMAERWRLCRLGDGYGGGVIFSDVLRAGLRVMLLVRRAFLRI